MMKKILMCFMPHSVVRVKAAQCSGRVLIAMRTAVYYVSTGPTLHDFRAGYRRPRQTKYQRCDKVGRITRLVSLICPNVND